MNAPKKPPFIRCENVTYTYEGEPALRGLTLHIDEGEFVCVLGHNGSGKSTFAKMLNALLTPGSGKVYVDGMDATDPKLTIDIRAKVGMVFQNPDNQLVTTLVEDDVAFGCENLGIDPDEIRERVDFALDAVGMTEYAEHATHQLSGGQKQRVAIAGILAMRPECIVLDEPTAMLDPRGREDVMDAIKMLNRDYGITVVLITHHMREAIDADRVIVLSDGFVLADDTPEAVFTNVDVLQEAGINVPDTVKLNLELRMPLERLRVDDCANAIYFAISERRKRRTAVRMFDAVQ